MNKFSISLCLTLTLYCNLTAMDQDLQVLAGQHLIAAQNDNKETIEALLMQGAPVDAKDSRGYTPLMWATWNGREDVCELLLTRNAQVNAKNNSGVTPLMCAALNGHQDACELLLTHKAHVDAKDNQGSTPLMLATRWGCKDVCKLLLTHNARVDAKDNASSTPLMWAAKCGRKDVCKWLIDVMIQKQHKFTKNKHAAITFLGLRKKNGCLKLIGHDMVLCIAQMVFDMAKKDNV